MNAPYARRGSGWVLWSCAGLLGLVPFPLLAADYVRDVKPVLQARCVSCHGALKQEAGLRLDTAESLVRGGESGAVVDVDAPDESVLIQRITAEDPDVRMPPIGKPLSADQIGAIRAWIGADTPHPGHETPEPDPRQHWAFRPLVRPPLPVAAAPRPDENSACASISFQPDQPIDRFLDAEHVRLGLIPLPAAESHVLARRLYLDLLGLPPTPAELQAFLADPRADAYEQLVDRLLAHPAYGERWGRHWMDVWRYSDWYGRRSVPDVLNSYARIWRWRDWIIRSLNGDLGYQRMIELMLAGDEVAPDDLKSVVATGFLVRNWYRWNYESWMKDNVEHTAKAFLGLTLNCCECHDHKYDPIGQEEYFRFRAFFEPLELRHERVPGEPDPGVYPDYVYGSAYAPITSGAVRVYDKRLDAPTYVYLNGDSRNKVTDQPPLTPAGVTFFQGDGLKIAPVSLSETIWFPALQPFAVEEDTARLRAEMDSAVQRLEECRVAKKGVAGAEIGCQLAAAALRAYQATLAADRARCAQHGNADLELTRTAARAQQERALWQARFRSAVAEEKLTDARAKDSQDAAVVQEIAALEKELATAKGAIDEANKKLQETSETYQPLGPEYPQVSSGRRTALARWIANPQNPLTSRVAVNHIWLRHFGRGLCATPENFGRSGAVPSHPQLIDWLACELIDHDWQMKEIHRQILTSRAYRRASSSSSAEVFAANRQLDPDNHYLWRFNPLRIEAEVVRDTILYVADELDSRMGGPEIEQPLGQSSGRRTIYFSHHGEEKMPFLDLFDAANTGECYRRTVSVRPQQALALINSQLAARCARQLARRITPRIATGNTDRPFIEQVFLRLLGRRPNSSEIATCELFLQRQRALQDSSASSDPSPNSDNEQMFSSAPEVRARGSFLQVMFNHTDFVTVR